MAVGRCYALAALIFSNEFLNLGALTFRGAKLKGITNQVFAFIESYFLCFQESNVSEKSLLCASGIRELHLEGRRFSDAFLAQLS